jgi:hypothetical protein
VQLRNLSTLAVLVVAAVLPREAYMARHPDYTRRTLVIGGPVARQIASFIGLREDTAGRLELELPMSMEHFSHPELDEKRRDSRGLLELHGDRKSALLRNTIAWDPGRGELTLGEHWFDVRTAMPHREGPAFSASSPEFGETDLGQVHGWQPIFQRLQGIAATKEQAWERRVKDFVVSPQLSLRLELVRIRWSGKLVLVLSVGPLVGASRVLPGSR